MFSFELAGDKLIMMAGVRPCSSRSPDPSGLYGDWTAMQNGFQITWSMRNGKIHATAACPSGSASTEVAAQFTNIVDILEDKSNMVGDDTFNCTVGIAKALAEYHFEGNDLVMVVNGRPSCFTAEVRRIVRGVVRSLHDREGRYAQRDLILPDLMLD